MILRKNAILDRFVGKQAVLRLENGQEFSILKEELGAAEAGASFVVQILPEAEAALAKEDLARTLINQLIDERPVRTASTAHGHG